jgi:hypothetical protein
MTNKKFRVELELTDDGPNSINFEDTYHDLNDEEWYIAILFDFLRKMILMNLGKIKFRAVIKQLK